MSNATWKAEVDVEVRKLTGGLGIDEITGDWASADLYEDGLTPKQAAESVVEDSDLADWF